MHTLELEVVTLDLDIVDPHQHFWRHGSIYSWLDEPGDPERFTGDDSAIRVDYLPDDLRRDFAGLRLVGSVAVEAFADDSLAEAQWLQWLHDSDGLPSAVVAGADLALPGTAEHLEKLAELPAVRGVRHVLNWHPDPHVTYASRGDLMSDPVWRANFARLAPLGLAFDLQVYPAQLRESARLAAGHPDTTIILNHTGMPRGADDASRVEWASGIDAVAAQPNTFVKISGLGMTDHDWSVESFRPFVRHAIETFGPERAMFASNFPVDKLYSDLATLYAAFDEVSADLLPSERDSLFRTTAARVYRLALPPHE